MGYEIPRSPNAGLLTAKVLAAASGLAVRTPRLARRFAGDGWRQRRWRVSTNRLSDLRTSEFFVTDPAAIEPAAILDSDDQAVDDQVAGNELSPSNKPKDWDRAVALRTPLDPLLGRLTDEEGRRESRLAAGYAIGNAIMLTVVSEWEVRRSALDSEPENPQATYLFRLGPGVLTALVGTTYDKRAYRPADVVTQVPGPAETGNDGQISAEAYSLAALQERFPNAVLI